MKNIKQVLFCAFLGLVAIIFSFLKISYMIGSNKLFLSGINLIFPILGAFCGILPSAIFILLFFLFKKIAFGIVPTFGIPTLISTIFFAVAVKRLYNKSILLEVCNFVLSVILPLLSIFLFVIHPVAKHAFLYSFYWFIPIAIYVLNRFGIFRSVFFISLSTTFIGHAVGGMIWLYMVEMTAAQWLTLIPIVAIERLTFACGITVSFVLFKKLETVFDKYFVKSKLFFFSSIKG